MVTCIPGRTIDYGVKIDNKRTSPDALVSILTILSTTIGLGLTTSHVLKTIAEEHLSKPWKLNHGITM